ncbi:MAG TPA: hypothetical protein VJ855_07375 [Marinilabiliaceae bacterium]|nr:hypothetical protein [Marinilabiliaceae bacterium]
MGVKLQELTEKIYSEGVEKAQKEADVILAHAKEKAAEIEKNANLKAQSIISTAEAEATKLKEHVNSELKMTVNQSVSALKQNLAQAVTMKSIQPSVQELFGNSDFLKSLIVKVVDGWISKDTMDLKIVLSEKERSEMESYFKNQLAKELNSGLELSFSEGVKSGFKIGPVDNSYEISFTDKDFINFFNAYLRPKTSELLFEESK